MPRHEQVSPDEDLATFYPDAAAPGFSASVAPNPSSIPSPVAASAPPGPAAPSAAPSSPVAPVPRPPVPVVRGELKLDPPPAVAANAPTPWIAGVLSLLLPGVGQIYAGQTAKGAVLLAVAFFTCAGGGLLSIVAALDAYAVAGRRQRGEALRDWQFF
jgi:hypothetical protein